MYDKNNFLEYIDNISGTKTKEETKTKFSKFYKDLQKQFEKAHFALQEDVEKWYWRLANNNEISYAEAKKLLQKNELKEFHWTVEEYIQYGKENAINQKIRAINC